MSVLSGFIIKKLIKLFLPCSTTLLPYFGLFFEILYCFSHAYAIFGDVLDFLFLIDLLKSQDVDSRLLSLSISVFVLFRFRFYGIWNSRENFTVKYFYGLKAINQNSKGN